MSAFIRSGSELSGKRVAMCQKPKLSPVIRRPSIDTLVDGCHGGYGNENDRYERT